MKNRICEGCFRSVPRSEMIGKRACSDTCRAKAGTKRKCKPNCPPDQFSDVHVTFKDGTQHIKRVCGVCKKGPYIGKLPDRIPRKLECIQEAMQRKYGDTFFTSRKWIRLRYDALKFYGARCMACQTTIGPMHVDHIRPRSKYPELELEFSNLQILCRDCNFGKTNRDETDWRVRGG